VDRKPVLCILAILCVLAQARAMECEKDTISIRADTGNYAYGELSCTSGRGLTAYYRGNLSDSVKVFAEEKGTDEYRIRLLADARSANVGVYKGEIFLRDRDGKEYAIKTRVRVGEATEDQISLSSYSLAFEIDKLNKSECLPVEVTNSGNGDLENLRAESITAEITSPDYGNKSWIDISDLSEKVFSPGEKKTLRICVNTNDDHPNLKQRDTKIAVYADSTSDSGPKLVKNEISVSLTTDLDTVWEKKYDLLKDQYQMLQKAYNGLSTYRNAILGEEDNGTGNASGNKSDLYTYTSLAKSYGELKDACAESERKLACANASSIEKQGIKYSNLAASYGILQTGYSKLLKNISGKVDKETYDNLTKERDTTKAEKDAIQKEIEELQSRADEKDVLLLSMTMKQRDNGTGNKTMAAGYAVLNLQEYSPYLPILLIAILALPSAYYIIRKYTQRSRKKEVVLKAPAIRTEAEEQKIEETEKQNASDHEALKLKERQKEALRQLLLQKLAEKAAEKK
jgi:hypothetical protein